MNSIGQVKLSLTSSWDRRRWEPLHTYVCTYIKEFLGAKASLGSLITGSCSGISRWDWLAWLIVKHAFDGSINGVCSAQSMDLKLQNAATPAKSPADPFRTSWELKAIGEWSGQDWNPFILTNSDVQYSTLLQDPSGWSSPFFFWNVQVTYLLQDFKFWWWWWNLMARPATAGSGRLLKKARARQLQTRVEIYNDAIPN